MILPPKIGRIGLIRSSLLNDQFLLKHQLLSHTRVTYKLKYEWVNRCDWIKSKWRQITIRRLGWLEMLAVTSRRLLPMMLSALVCFSARRRCVPKARACPLSAACGPRPSTSGTSTSTPASRCRAACWSSTFRRRRWCRWVEPLRPRRKQNPRHIRSIYMHAACVRPRAKGE